MEVRKLCFYALNLPIMGTKLRLVVMNFLQYAIWGAYLTSMGSYLVGVDLASHIGIFYAMQGIVSLFMPAVIGIVADRWVPAQRLLGICHLTAALFMAAAGYYAMSSGTAVSFGVLFTLYSFSVAFYMPTIALSNSVAYCVLEGAGLDTVKSFPPIRVWGTVGFICSMLVCDAAGFQTTYMQFIQCAVLGLVLGFYAMTLPSCPTSRAENKKSLVEALGLRAFTLSLHPAHSLLPQAFRHQERDAHGDAGLGAAFRAVRTGKPRIGCLDVHSLDDRLRRGLRLFQHLGLALRQ